MVSRQPTGLGMNERSLAKYKGNADYCGIDYSDLGRNSLGNSLENKHRRVQTHTTHKNTHNAESTITAASFAGFRMSCEAVARLRE